jgi:hypothetical protein
MPRMFAHLAAALTAATVLFAVRTAEAGYTVTYYSPPERVYGWCANVGNQQQTHNCARRNCIQQGGTACKPVTECGGWGAVAYAGRPIQGLGAGCAGDASSARRIALTACMSASEALCWTDVTFSPNGKKMTKADDLRFDRLWMAQLLLQINGKLYKGNIRGEADQELYTAAAKFQEKLGRTGTGILDNELIFRMIDGAGGTRHFAIIVKRDVLPSLEKAIAQSGADADRKYGHSAAPKRGSISEDFNDRSEEGRKVALATYLSARGSKCTLPAIHAQQMVPDVWSVKCNEADYTLILQGGQSIITRSGRAK